ncbi:hypothetical protein MMG85_11810 [Pseudoxanthomonas sp. LH2527]|uniref:phage tail tube protein n=1 Tax=Pseudoxanthomonas sp. LH2527 TaxID=2923249 RepID=UPI001F149152|nr:hypothetical protein [Pseudoxanthomonas sp. LH2527]MCH6484243.1 hypothetical protein [Pseudoxanthomonas sp. LH2527]
MEEPDYSYVGSGHILIKEFGAAAPFLPIGNCSVFNLAPQVNTLQLQDFTNPGGGIRNRIDRVNDVQFSLTFHDFNGENFARFLRGTSTKVVSGNASAEAVVGYKGGWVPLAKIAKTITSVEPVGGGTPYDAGDDYVLDNGGLYIPATSAITDPVAGAANFEVDYTYDAHTVTEAMVNAAKQYTMVLSGLNEARSGKPVRVTAHKVSGGVLATLGLLGEDYGAGEVSGSLLSDTSKGAGLSKFFQVVVVD